MKRFFCRNGGFSGIEVFVLIVIAAIAVILCIPLFTDAVDTSAQSALHVEGESVLRAARTYSLENFTGKTIPVSDSGYLNLCENPKSSLPFNPGMTCGEAVSQIAEYANSNIDLYEIKTLYINARGEVVLLEIGLAGKESSGAYVEGYLGKTYYDGKWVLVEWDGEAENDISEFKTE